MWNFKRFKKKKEPDAPSQKSTNVDKLDRAFSKYIRVRDAMPNGTIRCISCGQIKPFSSFDNGHYFSRMHMATRWDEDNCNAECMHCNRMTGGEHMIGYEKHLIEKIGQQRFAALALKAHSTAKRKDVMFSLLVQEMHKAEGKSPNEPIKIDAALLQLDEDDIAKCLCDIFKRKTNAMIEEKGLDV